MKKWFMKVLPMVAAIMGFDPEANEPLDFSAEDMQKLNTQAKQEGFAEAFMKFYNEEHVTANEDALKAYAHFMKEQNIKPAAAAENGEAQEDEVIPVADEKSATAALQALVKTADGLVKTNAQLAADNKKLKELPEDDVPEAVIQFDPKKTNTVKHSATHLFASNQSYDSLDRSWNKNVIDAQNGIIKPSASTVWDKVNIDKLNSDLGAYARRNATEIMDLLMDGYDIPAHWSVVSNIQDQYVFSSIVSGQITQSFKKAFLPKNKQRFIPVLNKIFDKQIDGSWQSSELKSIEKSWLNMFFNEGSTPYKDSFSLYLIEKLLNQARKEDKISIFKGVYSNPELQPTVAGDFINSMNGFLKLVNDHKNVDYKPHALAALTSTNTYSVIKSWLENDIPLDVRNQPGLKLGVGNDVHRWYIEGRETAKGLMPNYDKNAMNPEDFMNIEFVKHPQLEGSGFIYLTMEDNIGLMIDRAGEESLLTIEKKQRAIDFFADWKLGVFFKGFGGAVDSTDPLNYDNQIFFSNDVVVLKDTYVPIGVNDATPSLSEHYALKVGGNNAVATNITNFDDAVAGQVVYLYCDDATNAPTIKNNANIVLATGADFVMAKGDKLTLLYSNSKFIEFSRTVASEAALETKVTIAADATTADAADGTWFVTSANTQATAFTNIANAIVDEVYTIEGGSATDSTTIASSGNFLLSATFTASAGAILKVKYNGSKFVEQSRA
ncbi:hypothetical protein ES692_06115 [Psychroserpens burtonensis]|uniref:Depolymerase 2 capsule K5-specific C-terminal domain-containing protein n=1 Tax=Psychroserpens burtonensis TaxID=49278 RepID=A0A5C7B8K2_9FLAO|nr:hypothetical protein [Psychroserpens burtonensis]TXE18616.1 hypothetical protein ES692_06115 [Psychroserpens burtonensis]